MCVNSNTLPIKIVKRLSILELLVTDLVFLLTSRAALRQLTPGMLLSQPFLCLAYYAKRHPRLEC